MKSYPLLVALMLLVGAVPGFATAVGISTVEQPVNLGVRSDPTRIPLGKVGVISNHGYGVLGMIGEARPCPDGAMVWEGGSELDQNLASVFGISVEAVDPTQMIDGATLRVKAWKPPGYSPYSKEQAVAATLWCLLRSVHATPEHPLDVRVIAEGAADKALEKKFSGKYVTAPGKGEKTVPPVKVEGTVIEEDARGIAWVVFPDVARGKSFKPLIPGLIILENIGEGDSGWHILPVWGSRDGHDPLELSQRLVSICYSAFHSKGVRNANSFLDAGGASGFNVVRGENSDAIRIYHPHVSQEMLAANILALVVAAQPTADKPLVVSFLVEERSLADYPAFRSSAGWKETKQNGPYNYYQLECEFVWDSAARKLVKGSIPLVAAQSNGWIIPELERSADAKSSEFAKAVAQRIKSGIHDGSLLAEKNLPSNSLAESGIQRQVGLAGYYEALASYCDKAGLPVKPMINPMKFEDSELDQLHQLGWDIGLSRAQVIAIEVQKAMEKEAGESGSIK